MYDILSNTQLDGNRDGEIDSCSSDCNGNGIFDVTDIHVRTSVDCNKNNIPDSCEGNDCDSNGVLDSCDIESGSSDCNNDKILDVCQSDCNSCNLNNILDKCDISSGVSLDCNGNQIPDTCDLKSGISQDCNQDQVPDECVSVWDNFVEAQGRAIVVQVSSLYNDASIHVKSQNDQDLSGYVQRNGQLGPIVFKQSKTEWCRTIVSSDFILPEQSYLVEIRNADQLVFSTVVITPKWGNVDGDGILSFKDVNLVVSAFVNGNYSPRYDLSPCLIDGVIDMRDVHAAVNAFLGTPFSTVCP
jgi:hypothetical protein